MSQKVWQYGLFFVYLHKQNWGCLGIDCDENGSITRRQKC
jgi:hypothetical protein